MNKHATKILSLLLLLTFLALLFCPFFLKAQNFDSLPNVTNVLKTDKTYSRQVGATTLRRVTMEQIYGFVNRAGNSTTGSMGSIKILSGTAVVGDTNIAASAIAEFKSTTKGVLFPRLTTGQMLSISSPATSLWIFNTDSGKFYYYHASTWKQVGGASPANTTETIYGAIDSFTVNEYTHSLADTPTVISCEALIGTKWTQIAAPYIDDTDSPTSKLFINAGPAYIQRIRIKIQKQ